jgi:LysR family transcriptional regulator, transcriptional activator of the cysJI operon
MRRYGALRSALDCSLLQAFVRVADMGNTSAAARALSLAQSAVSTQMSMLSRVAGAPLLERSHGRWELTHSGAVFYRRAREILNLVDLLERELADAADRISGHLVVASTRTISDTILAPIVAGFAAAHPDIRLDIVPGDRRDAEMRLAGGEVDAALVALPIAGKGVNADVFERDDLVLVVPASHHLANRDAIAFDECASEAFVVFARGSGVRALLEERLGERFDALDVRLELSSNDALLRCVEAGIGATFLPQRVAAKWVASAPIALVRIADVDLVRELALAFPETGTHSLALATFRDWLMDTFRTSTSESRAIANSQ